MSWIDTINEMMAPLMEGKWDAPIALGSTALGMAGLGSGIYDSFRNRGYENQARKQLTGDLDIDKFYRPMTDIESRMLRNSMAAELAARGLPADSAYTTGAIAESQAKSNVDRYNTAAQLAIQDRNSKLAGYNALTGLMNSGRIDFSKMNPLAALVSLRKEAALRKMQQQINDAWAPKSDVNLQWRMPSQRPSFGISGIDTSQYGSEEPEPQVTEDDLMTFPYKSNNIPSFYGG